MTKFLVPSLSVLVLITSLDIIYHFPKSTSEVTSFRAYPSNPRKDDIPIPRFIDIQKLESIIFPQQRCFKIL